MKFWQRTYIEAVGHIRQPTYFLSTLFFPSLFFLFFAVPNIEDTQGALLLATSFSVFAVVGVAFSQLANVTAQDRHHPWSDYLDTLPVSRWNIWLSRLLTTLLFSVLTAATVLVTAFLTTPLILSVSALFYFLAILILGALVFCAFGLFLGMWLNSKNALPITNMIYLPLSFIGGLWLPPEILPRAIRPVSEWLPTRFFVEVGWHVTLQRPFPHFDFWALIVFGLICTLLTLATSFRPRS